MIPELLPRVNIAYMNFDRRQLHRLQRIADGNTGVRVCRRIDYNAIGSIEKSFTDSVNQSTFTVALEKFNLNLQLFRHLAKTRLNLRQCAGSIHLGLAPTEQMKIRTVDH